MMENKYITKRHSLRTVFPSLFWVQFFKKTSGRQFNKNETIENFFARRIGSDRL